MDLYDAGKQWGSSLLRAMNRIVYTCELVVVKLQWQQQTHTEHHMTCNAKILTQKTTEKAVRTKVVE